MLIVQLIVHCIVSGCVLGNIRQEFGYPPNMRFHIDAMRISLVLRQMVALYETGLTDITFVPFAGVSPDVRLQIVTLCKAFDTMRTLIRFLAGMDSHMDQQVVGTLESLSANGTHVRSFARVIALVNG